jgi:hypothetical protein
MISRQKGMKLMLFFSAKERKQSMLKKNNDTVVVNEDGISEQDLERLKKKMKKKVKTSKVKVKHVGRFRTSVVILWVVLIVSVAFGVYKNFTAIDKHTTHEVKEIKEVYFDTSGIENYVINFAKYYYTWENTEESIERRDETIQWYLADDVYSKLQQTVAPDIDTTIQTTNVQVSDVDKLDKQLYEVIYTVFFKSKVTTDGKISDKYGNATYSVQVHEDKDGTKVIVSEPKPAKYPYMKSDYQLETESAGIQMSLNNEETTQITEMLDAFFELYPRADEKELAYYEKNNVMPVLKQDYTLVEINNGRIFKADKQVKAIIDVTYYDEVTHMTIITNYDLTLEKDNNWLITEMK